MRFVEKLGEAVVNGDVPMFLSYLAGKWGGRGGVKEVKSPIDMSILAKVAMPSSEEVEEVVATVYVKGRWAARDLPGERRVRILRRASELLEKNAELFEEVLVINAGKTRPQAKGEVKASIDRLKLADLDLKKVSGEYVPGDWTEDTLETEAVVRREPLGVVLAITPFNYPLFDVVNKVVYSFIYGNAVLVKPASATPLPALMFAKILIEAGYPPEALGVLPISGTEAEKLVADDRIAAVSFTGSYESGEKVVRAGGVKQYILELGGGDPAIVLNDADLELAVDRIARGIYSYAGQRCDAIKLILAEGDIYESLKHGLAKRLREVKVGDPRDPEVEMGPLISSEAVEEMFNAIDDAVKKGGSVVVGGERLGPNYVKPTLIEASADKVRDMELYRREIFAPIALIVRVKDLDEAVELANGRPFGLDASIFGKDITTIRKAIRLLEVGAVYVNDMPRHGIGYYPFGGRKKSGVYREGIGYSVEAVTAYKTIVFNYRDRGVWRYTT